MGSPRLDEQMILNDITNKVLPAPLLRVVRLIGREASNAGIDVYLVGGIVRDMLLGRKNLDLDIVVEGNALGFGHELKSVFGGTLVEHKRFGTASLFISRPGSAGRIDIAAARREKYEKPAALPAVEFAQLKDDLYRRDFTINAMAVKIEPGGLGALIDMFGGRDDLKKGFIRALHDRSFIDDPTRIFRAVRFEQRFGFKIELRTGYLIRDAASRGMVRLTEAQRIREELILICREEKPEKAVLRMRDLHELVFIHKDLSFSGTLGRMFAVSRSLVKWYGVFIKSPAGIEVWIINFLIMIDSLGVKETREVTDKFVFSNDDRNKILSFKENRDNVRRHLERDGKMLPSEVCGVLRPLSDEVILSIMARSRPGVLRERCRKYLRSYRDIKLKVTGDDLIKLGLPRGPRYREILKKALSAKLDGKLPGKADELRYLEKNVTQNTP
ncbi:MAG: CCA tRNA nucleotidyltransferase [Candidatus Omnitrophica bacterium]|nr:CCA tRNA nucleotidyltransferase [Candidatus Omnitrophota bacterium]